MRKWLTGRLSIPGKSGPESGSPDLFFIVNLSGGNFSPGPGPTALIPRGIRVSVRQAGWQNIIPQSTRMSHRLLSQTTRWYRQENRVVNAKRQALEPESTFFEKISEDCRVMLYIV